MSSIVDQLVADLSLRKTIQTFQVCRPSPKARVIKVPGKTSLKDTRVLRQHNK